LERGAWEVERLSVAVGGKIQVGRPVKKRLLHAQTKNPPLQKTHAPKRGGVEGKPARANRQSCKRSFKHSRTTEKTGSKGGKKKNYRRKIRRYNWGGGGKV